MLPFAKRAALERRAADLARREQALLAQELEQQQEQKGNRDEMCWTRRREQGRRGKKGGMGSNPFTGKATGDGTNGTTSSTNTPAPAPPATATATTRATATTTTTAGTAYTPTKTRTTEERKNCTKER